MSEFVVTDLGVREEESAQETSRMQRWLVRVKSKRGLALRDVFIVAKDETTARHRVQQMYLLSDITTICPQAAPVAKTPPTRR